MALGYHKINTSAARNKINEWRGGRRCSGDDAQFVQPGTAITCPNRGLGKTCLGFVSDCDVVFVRFDSGDRVQMTGREIRLLFPPNIPLSGRRSAPTMG